MDLDRLVRYLYEMHLDAIVVEGYDGVGKGRVLNAISEKFGVIPYRPDYNLWQKYDHRAIDRWKISGFFWDVYSHFNIHAMTPLLFDRGALSGAVYNNDPRIAEDYRDIIKNMRVMHIIVTCSFNDYEKFSKSRNPSVGPIEVSREYEKYENATDRYLDYVEKLGLDHIVYQNVFDPFGDSLKDLCEGCGHYSYGICRHPAMNVEVNPKNKRCLLSLEKEVQDNVAEVYSM